MKALLEHVVRELVDAPELASVEEVTAETGTSILSIKTGQNDSGKIIGREGRNIQALRTILSAVAARKGCRVVVEVCDLRQKDDLQPRRYQRRRAS